MLQAWKHSQCHNHLESLHVAKVASGEESAPACAVKNVTLQTAERGHKGNTTSLHLLGQRESSICTPKLVLSTEALQIRQTPNRQAHTPTSWKYLRPLVCPLMKVTENKTHICLLRAFLFWLENQPVEEIENKKCKSSSPLAQIRLAQAHTSAWRRSSRCLHF